MFARLAVLLPFLVTVIACNYHDDCSPPSKGYGSEIHVVTVGANGKLAYVPPFVEAKVGDTVVFKFFPKNHTVTESTFDKPCTHRDRGLDSDFNFAVGPQQVNLTAPVYSFPVKDEKPHWFYCRQSGHCQAGMVFAVNPPSYGNTFEKFQDMAKKTQAPSPPPPKLNNEPVTHIVQVGPEGKLVFDPPTTYAKSGEVVRFIYNAKNHTVTESSFNDPCVKLSISSNGHRVGFDSGFEPFNGNTSAGHPVFDIVIEDDKKPIWGYCRQTGHCKKGMVFAINPPEKEKNYGRNFEAFQKLAKWSNDHERKYKD